MEERTSGGVNNIPLTRPESTYKDNLTSEVKLEKRVLFDWISFTFDDLDFAPLADMDLYVTKTAKYIQSQSELLNDLIRVLGEASTWDALELKPGIINNFKYSIVIGESIIINLHGPKSFRGRRVSQLLMRGEGCSEFIEYQRGSWYNLFGFLCKLNGQFRRVDLSIDDFSGKEVDIYYLEKLARDGHWTGSFQSCKIISDISYRGGIRSKGYSLTFGSAGSIQLQIYDKLLEMWEKTKKSIETKVWYRYEMRLVGTKANEVIRQYMLLCRFGFNETFMSFALSILNSLISFKSKPKSNDSRVRRWPVDENWSSFIESRFHMNVIKGHPRKLTIDEKKIWYDKSIVTTNAQFYLTDPNQYYATHLHQLMRGIRNITSEQLVAVNKKRIENGFSKLVLDEVKSSEVYFAE